MNGAHYVSVEAVDLQSEISLVGVRTERMTSRKLKMTTKIINGSIQLTASMNSVDSLNSFRIFDTTNTRKCQDEI
jgi:hypothetical protein